MSLEFDSRFWYPDSLLIPSEAFEKAVNSIQKTESAQIQIERIRVRHGAPGNFIVKENGPFSVSEALKLLSDLPDQEKGKITAYIPLSFWRFSDTEASMGKVFLAISLWGSEYGSTYYSGPYEGNGQISFINAGPFFALLNEEGDISSKSAANSKVESNVGKVLEILQELVGSLPITKLHLWSDAGPLTPLNSHLAYYQSEEWLAKEFSILSSEIANGKLSEALAHQFRSPERQNELKSSFSNIASLKNTTDAAKRAKNSENFDFLENGNSFFVLDYPFFANAFLDEFYLSSLK